MSTLQIPTVTLNDLEAFWTKHFSGHDYAPAEEITADNDDYDDDLGYYPDGVKRTLTDEQIEIFRHSEIHSLLREKRLREETLAESREEELSSEHGDAESTDQGEKKNSKDVDEKATNAKRDSGVSGQVGDNTASKKRRLKSDQPNTGTLDYDVDGSGSGSGHGSLQKDASHAPDLRTFRRRIVSYAD